MARKTLIERRTDKLAELARLQHELAQLEAQAAERIGRIAVRSGLADMEIDEVLLAQEFAAVAARFRQAASKSTQSDSSDQGTSS